MTTRAWNEASETARPIAAELAASIGEEHDFETVGMIGAWLVMIACVRIGGDGEAAVVGARRFATLIENGVTQLALERTEFFHGQNGKGN